MTVSASWQVSRAARVEFSGRMCFAGRLKCHKLIVKTLRRYYYFLASYSVVAMMNRKIANHQHHTVQNMNLLQHVNNPRPVSILLSPHQAGVKDIQQ